MDHDDRLHDLLAGLPRLEPGHVWLVGAGPGDAGYLTLHAVSALRQADVIVHDALIDDGVPALARPEARLEPAGKRGHQPSVEQGTISARLVELAREGQRVVRLKGRRPVHVRPRRRGDAGAGRGRHPVPHRLGRHRRAGRAGRGADPADAPRRQPGGDLRHRPRRRRRSRASTGPCSPPPASRW